MGKDGRWKLEDCRLRRGSATQPRQERERRRLNRVATPLAKVGRLPYGVAHFLGIGGETGNERESRPKSAFLLGYLTKRAQGLEIGSSREKSPTSPRLRRAGEGSSLFVLFDDEDDSPLP